MKQAEETESAAPSSSLSQPSPEEKKHRGIPEAIFVEDVEAFIKQSGSTGAEQVIKKMDELYNKYRFMELNLSQRKNRLKIQIPDLKNSLEIVRNLKKCKERDEELSTHFMVSDNLYMKGKVPPTDTISLWLGANVMLEYSLDGAEELLEKNLKNAVTGLEKVNDDLAFLREQITTTEVNMARLYNWDVKRRKKKSEAEKSST